MRKRLSFLWPAAAALAAATLASCALGPDYSRPAVDTPGAFKGAATQSSDQPRLGQDWWRLFDDKTLTDLEEEALRANQNLKAAMARVEQARAASQAVRSQFYPTVTFNPSVLRSRSLAGGAGPASVGTGLLFPLDLAYEVDVWGKIRRSYEAAKAQFQASVDDAAVVQQTLQADVATTYFTIRSLDAQDKIILENVESYRQQVTLTQTQVKVGMADQTVLMQAQTLLESTLTQEIETRRQRADLEHALALLLGRAPAEFSLPFSPLDLKSPSIPPGLPADLLRRRPDVAEAEQNLAAASAQIGVATANFFPAVSLTGSAGFESTDLRHAFDWQHRVWSYGGGVSQPVFEGGLLTANLQQARARFDELLATYRNTVLAAFQGVEDSLCDARLQAEEAQTQTLAVTYSRDYLKLAQTQYEKGTASYLQVIDAERTLLTNELLAAQILNQQLNSTVLLIKSLGGGWDAHAAATQPAP